MNVDKLGPQALKKHPFTRMLFRIAMGGIAGGVAGASLGAGGGLSTANYFDRHAPFLKLVGPDYGKSALTGAVAGILPGAATGALLGGMYDYATERERQTNK